jgi:hypothetical protein
MDVIQKTNSDELECACAEQEGFVLYKKTFDLLDWRL